MGVEVVFEQGQVERSRVCVCVLLIRLSPGETSPSDGADPSLLSSCYKTGWPSAMGGDGGGHWDNTQ